MRRASVLLSTLLSVAACDTASDSDGPGAGSAAGKADTATGGATDTGTSGFEPGFGSSSGGSSSGGPLSEEELEACRDWTEDNFQLVDICTNADFEDCNADSSCVASVGQCRFTQFAGRDAVACKIESSFPSSECHVDVYWDTGCNFNVASVITSDGREDL